MSVSPVLLVVTLFSDVAGALPTNTLPVQTPSDKVICKRMPVTGSLASSVKVCRTQHEWVIAQETARAEGRRLLSTRMPDSN